ncbi:MAG TPA: GtrA family protein [Candidatus Nanoarchaeia archaeon]|nr:GtrA family protein [Candidatus Nanoarchaeia archaeon]
MLKKTFAYFWSLRKQFVKYFIVGIGAVVLDMGSLIALKEYFKIAPVIAVFLNQILVWLFVFYLNKHWSFKAMSRTKRQMFRFSIVVAFDYLFSVVTMYIFNEKLKLDYRLVRLASIALAVSWNFFLYKYWVYAGLSPAAAGDQDAGPNSAAL